MTYSETQGHEPFNWNKALFWAPLTCILQGPFWDLKARSRSWVTCACGNACDSIPRHPGGNGHFSPGCPLDNVLALLGTSFHAAIEGRNWRHAKFLLKKIEARSAFLIAKPTP